MDKINYEITELVIENEDGETATTYGIEATADLYSLKISDISCDKLSVENLVEHMKEQNTPLDKIPETVEDYVSTVLI